MDSGNGGETNWSCRRYSAEELQELERRLSDRLGLLDAENALRQRLFEPWPETEKLGTARSTETVIEGSEGQEAMSADRSKELAKDIVSHEEQKVTGRNADEDRRAIRSEIASLPDVRAEKVREVQGRIREGFYDRPEVLDEIVDRLLQSWPDKGPTRDPRGER